MTDTGGPAFPFQIDLENRDGTITRHANFGMTLRDYFAAKAMQALMHTQYADMTYEGESAAMAHEAYRLADAMIKERIRHG